MSSAGYSAGALDPHGVTLTSLVDQSLGLSPWTLPLKVEDNLHVFQGNPWGWSTLHCLIGVVQMITGVAPPPIWRRGSNSVRTSVQDPELELARMVLVVEPASLERQAAR